MPPKYHHFIVFMCVILLVALAGCGKKANPVPQDQKNFFAWESASASFTANGCLALSGLMTGAVRNVDGFSLELQPLDAPTNSSLPEELRTAQDTCEGCPFTPAESSEITPQMAEPLKNKTRFAFTYCPKTKAAAFRWRIVARNVFLSFPYVMTQIGVVR